MKIYKADIIMANGGSIWAFNAGTLRGRSWLLENCEGAYDTRVLVEHRYGYDIAIGAMRAGLKLQDANTGRVARMPKDMSTELPGDPA
jgi:hypothetical protein